MGKSTEVQTDGKSLLKAVYLSRLRLTRLLLEGGAYINESNDQGETPLMVACMSHHTDVQSVPKQKIVRYLLENGADPNIQDKTGKSALMHACLEQAGPEILSLLLSFGADPTLEDQAGLSSLVYAVSSGNKEVLRVLLDACKAKGKEVIIITTNKLLSGHQLTKQYLNVPPPSDLKKCLHYTPPSCSMPPCETHLQSPPQGPSGSASPSSGGPLCGHSDPKTSGSGAGLPTSRPASAIQHPSAFRIPFMDKLLQQSRSHSLTEVVDITPESELCFRISRLAGRPLPVSSDYSIDVNDPTELLTAPENMSGINSLARRGRRSLGRKMSYDSATSSANCSSHPNWHQNGSLPFPCESAAVVEDSSDFLPQMNASSLQNTVAWRNIGLDHYSSDSQLPQFGSSYPSSSAGAEAKAEGEGEERSKPSNSKSSTLSGSRESLENFKHRRNAAVLDRRGSGALLLDHISHTRPGYLPPLNPHAPMPDIGVSPASSYLLNGRSKTLSGVLTGSKPSLPSATHFLRDVKDKKMLWRRHSMQSEQIKQLAMFEETFGQ